MIPIHCSTQMNVFSEGDLKQLSELGFSSCQIACWDLSCHNEEMANKVRAALDEYGVRVSTFWAGWSGPQAWNFTEGPTTLGIVPKDLRETRVRELKAGSDFAKMIGVDQLATHAGFLPECPTSEGYDELIAAIREVAAHCKANGQYFLFETGQETPVTLRRVIDDVGLDNLAVNLDPANFTMVTGQDAVEVFW